MVKLYVYLSPDGCPTQSPNPGDLWYVVIQEIHMDVQRQLYDMIIENGPKSLRDLSGNSLD